MSEASAPTPIAPITDGRVTIRAPLPGDERLLIAGRDPEFHRFMGAGSDHPAPSACVVVDADVAGWVDYDPDLDWLATGQVNIGYNVFAAHRGRGVATRAVQLLMHHLAMEQTHDDAVLLIEHANTPSLAVAERCGFVHVSDTASNRLFHRPVPSPSPSDGIVTLRRQSHTDLDADLAAKDAEQMRWLWTPADVARWAAMTPAQQREHASNVLQDSHDAFGRGPKWTFSVDTRDAQCVGYVDCDLANDKVPAGEANISYACSPTHRRRGYTTRAVRLVLKFLREHTAAREAHLLVDTQNAASLRVARAVNATPLERWSTGDGQMIRHVVPLVRTHKP